MFGVLSLFEPQWTVPAAITGCLFYGLAGLKHLLEPARNRSRNIAHDLRPVALSSSSPSIFHAAFFQNA